jgi:transcription elongation factor Elf1
VADYVDIQYATLIGTRQQRFDIKSRNPLKINCRCPLCGDSKKRASKARGWITESTKTSRLFYNCFNCGAGMSFEKFLESQDPSLYNDYIAERFLNGDNLKRQDTQHQTADEEKPTFNKDPLKIIKKISQLRHDHPAKKYIEQRQIPSNQHYRIFYAPKFKTWINSIIPDKFPPFKKDEPRLILPFIDENGRCFGVSARSFDPNGFRYISIMFDDVPKIFGIDQVDFSKRYYVVEGSIDSLFLDNAIAMAGADGNTNSLENVENAVFVFDLEYRNKEIMKRVEKIIDKGLNVCLLPKNMAKYGKDINEFVLNGVSPVYIQECIDANIYKGLSAKIRLAELKNC